MNALKLPSSVLLAVSLCSVPARVLPEGLHCPTRYSAPVFKGRVGKVAFNNQSNETVVVTLFHPQVGQFFSTYKVAPQQNIYLGQDMRVGDDWGIHMNGSGICNVAEVADYQGKGKETVWQTSSKRFPQRSP